MTTLAEKILNAMPLHESVDAQARLSLLAWLDVQLKQGPQHYVNEDGEVGVVYSASYGIGWYSRIGDTHPHCATDPELVRLVLEYRKNRDELEERKSVRSWELCDDHPEIKKITGKLSKYLAEKYPGVYANVSNFAVSFFPKGTTVQVDEHDGNERIYVTYNDTSVIKL